MKHKDWVALFKIFLEMNDALIAYLEGVQGFRDVYEGTDASGSPENFILHAFSWDNNEGKSSFEYWQALFYKWNKVIQDVNSRA